MKKIFSVLISLTIVFSSISVCFAAENHGFFRFPLKKWPIPKSNYNYSRSICSSESFVKDSSFSNNEILVVPLKDIDKEYTQEDFSEYNAVNIIETKWQGFDSRKYTCPKKFLITIDVNDRSVIAETVLKLLEEKEFYAEPVLEGYYEMDKEWVLLKESIEKNTKGFTDYSNLECEPNGVFFMPKKGYKPEIADFEEYNAVSVRKLGDGTWYSLKLAEQNKENVVKCVFDLFYNPNVIIAQPNYYLHSCTGDINADGVVNIADRMYLTRALANWENYEVTAETADANNDGKVDIADRMILTRHLAGWAGYESLPYVQSNATVN